eukprot:7190-Heterococcus_DN1.PRE.1
MRSDSQALSMKRAVSSRASERSASFRPLVTSASSSRCSLLCSEGVPRNSIRSIRPGRVIAASKLFKRLVAIRKMLFCCRRRSFSCQQVKGVHMAHHQIHCEVSTLSVSSCTACCHHSVR